jgi:hypothetical protein
MGWRSQLASIAVDKIPTKPLRTIRSIALPEEVIDGQLEECYRRLGPARSGLVHRGIEARPSRPPDYRAESNALLALAQ